MVAVAFDTVALVAIMLSVLVVEAFVVLAFTVWKLPVVPQRVVIVARTDRKRDE